MKSELFLALESAAWPALLASVSGVILRANPAAVAMFGPLAEGTATLGASVWAADNRTSAEAFLGQLDRTAVSVWPLKFRLKDGTTVEWRAHVSQASREGQRVILMQLFPQGGSDPGSDASSAHNHKLDRTLQLARTVALDFNNALTSILGHTSFILSRTDATNSWRGSLLEIQKSAYRAAELASVLAAFSRQDKDSGAPASGNLNDLIRRVAAPFQAATNPILNWSFALESKPFAARFDEAKIQQALTRIVENSVEASQSGGEITIRTRNHEFAEPWEDRPAILRPGCYVCVEIEDAGSGIPDDAVPRIFEPFFTTKQASGHRGVGLAWAYGIVSNHGGAIAVTTAVGLGTAFRIYLPSTRRVILGKPDAPADLCGTETILMVDDEELLLTLGEMVLSSSGYRVVTATSGRAALEIYSKAPENFDLVVTDLVMPQMTGRELVEQLRRISPNLPIICTSGYARALSPEEEQTYLQKPFTSEDLLRKVRQVLALRSAGA